MSGARLQKTILAVVLLAVLSCGASSASACSTSSHCYALATKTVSSPSGFRGVSADLSATCLDVPSPTTYFVTNEVWIAYTSDWVEAGLAHGVPNGDRKYFFWARQYNGVYYESSPLPGGDPALATYYTATITSANQSRLWNVTIHGNTSTPHGPTYPAIRLDTGTETTHENGTRAYGSQNSLQYMNLSGSWHSGWNTSSGNATVLTSPTTFGTASWATTNVWAKTGVSTTC